MAPHPDIFDIASTDSAAIAGTRRLIRIAVHPGTVRAVVADDVHHFRVEIHHDNQVVTGYRTEALRIPFSLCDMAGGRLQQLVGQPLTPRITDIHRQVDGRQQCTHQFDLAALAVVAAARQRSRGYDLVVSDPVEKQCDAWLRRDDGFILHWRIDRNIICAPEPYARLNVGSGFTDWVSHTCDDDDAEAALTLRRAHFISRGRGMLDEINARTHAPDRGGCWVQQPERAEKAMSLTLLPTEGKAPRILNATDAHWLAEV